jgi:hypothetical protein
MGPHRLIFLDRRRFPQSPGVDEICSGVHRISGQNRHAIGKNRKQHQTRKSMKVFAIASILQGVSIEQIQQLLPKEVPATLKHYLEGKIEQFWFRENAGPIFLMNAESVEQAKAELDTLPLVAAKLMTYDLMPVTTLTPFGLLIQGK